MTLLSFLMHGLDKAVKELLPHIEHRFCTKHLYSNLKSNNGKDYLNFALYEAANASHPEAFKAAMKKMEKACADSYKKMSELNPKAWSKAYFDTHSKSDSIDNNMSECFNSWIMKTRYMPIIDMLTEIHDLIMERLHVKRDLMAPVDSVLLPRIRRQLDGVIKDSKECRCLWDDRENYQVKWRGIGFCVNLREHTCSCRDWQLTGIPCIHGVTAILSCRKDPLSYVSKYYTKESYMKCYTHCLEVLRGAPFWEEVPGDTILPPVFSKVLRGRPKRQRRREGWESQRSSSRPRGKQPHRLPKKGKGITCGNCKNVGHNSRTCPEPRNPAYNPKKTTRKRGRGVAEELAEEMQHAEEEVETGEADLMEEALRENMQSQTHSTVEDASQP